MKQQQGSDAKFKCGNVEKYQRVGLYLLVSGLHGLKFQNTRNKLPPETDSFSPSGYVNPETTTSSFSQFTVVTRGKLYIRSSREWRFENRLISTVTVVYLMVNLEGVKMRKYIVIFECILNTYSFYKCSFSHLEYSLPDTGKGNRGNLCGCQLWTRWMVCKLENLARKRIV